MLNLGTESASGIPIPAIQPSVLRKLFRKEKKKTEILRETSKLLL